MVKPCPNCKKEMLRCVKCFKDGKSPKSSDVPHKGECVYETCKRCAEIIESKQRIKELEDHLDNLLVGLECKLPLKEHLKCKEHYLSLGKAISKSAWEYKEKIKKLESEVERQNHKIEFVKQTTVTVEAKLKAVEDLLGRAYRLLNGHDIDEGLRLDIEDYIAQNKL